MKFFCKRFKFFIIRQKVSIERERQASAVAAGGRTSAVVMILSVSTLFQSESSMSDVIC